MEGKLYKNILISCLWLLVKEVIVIGFSCKNSYYILGRWQVCWWFLSRKKYSILWDKRRKKGDRKWWVFCMHLKYMITFEWLAQFSTYKHLPICEKILIFSVLCFTIETNYSSRLRMPYLLPWSNIDQTRNQP